MNTPQSAYGYGLYYPYIQFRDENWVKTAVLYYDGVKRIVPAGFETHDSSTIRLLNDRLQFVEDLDPRTYAEDIAEPFLNFAIQQLTDPAKKATILDRIGRYLPPDSGFDIHSEKIADILKEPLTRVGLLERSDKKSPWYRFDPVTGAIYMTYLANRMAEDRGLPIVTDEAAYQPIVRWFQSGGSETAGKDYSGTGHALASLVIEAAMPENIEAVSIEQLIDFRKRHDDERRRFYNEIEKLAADIPNVDNQDAFKECLNHHKKGIEQSVSEFRRSLAGIKIGSVTALFGLSIPSWATSMANILPGSQMPIITAGAVCAGAAVLMKQGYNYYRSRTNSPWSYVLSLRKGMRHETLLRQLLEDLVLF